MTRRWGRMSGLEPKNAVGVAVNKGSCKGGFGFWKEMWSRFRRSSEDNAAWDPRCGCRRKSLLWLLGPWALVTLNYWAREPAQHAGMTDVQQHRSSGATQARA